MRTTRCVAGSGARVESIRWVDVETGVSFPSLINSWLDSRHTPR